MTPHPPAQSVPRLFRVILPVSDIGKAAAFYARLLGIPGDRVSPGRHYFDCAGVILACFDPRADGDPFDASPLPDHVYFAVDDLAATHRRALLAGCARIDAQIQVMPWGERSFYALDPFQNPICFVDARTCFTGHAPTM
jgi:catechol 2,3-dioxygenase-like lactoylglutathione lyase family enzyme